jgi:Carboxypeptidase regulatory-like domain
MRSSGTLLRRAPCATALLALTLLAGGCARGFIGGRVLDTGGNPVPNAQVRLASGGGTVTDASGTFRLTARRGERPVTFNALGFAETLKTYPVRGGQETRSDVILIPQGAPVSFQAEAGGDVPLPAGGQVLIRPNSLVRANGQPASGTVQARVAFIDPREPMQLLGGPGALTQGSGDSRAPMVSGGMLRVEVTDASGERLELAPGTTAEIQLPGDLVTRPPQSFTMRETNVRPDNVPADALYVFNMTTRQWEWVAPLQVVPGSNFLSAQASSLAPWWNYDKVEERTCVDVRVMTPAGAPRANTHVIVFGIDYNGYTDGYTDALGRASLLARRSSQVLVNSGSESVVQATPGVAEPCVDAGVLTF